MTPRFPNVSKGLRDLRSKRSQFPFYCLLPLYRGYIFRVYIPLISLLYITLLNYVLYVLYVLFRV